MARHIPSSEPTSLVIPNADTISNVLGAGELDNTDCIAIHCCETVLTGTVTVEVSPVTTGTAATDWQTLQSPPGTDVAIAADKCIVLTKGPFRRLRLVSSGAEGAARTFKVTRSVKP